MDDLATAASDDLSFDDESGHKASRTDVVAPPLGKGRQLDAT